MALGILRVALGFPRSLSIVRNSMENTLQRQAKELADAIRAAAPRGKTGALQQSVKAEKVKVVNNIMTVRVTAGGATTIVQARNIPYDYARAVEFGTNDTAANPFFWTVYRQHRKAILSAIRNSARFSGI